MSNIYTEENNKSYIEKVSKLEKKIIIPNHILNELLEYTTLIEMGIYSSKKWDTIRILLRLAIANNTITKEFAEYIEKTFYIEKI